VDRKSAPFLGMVRHMTDNEQWFGSLFTGEALTGTHCTEESPDGDLENVADADAAADFVKFAGTVQATRAASSRRDLSDIEGTEGFQLSIR